MGYKEKSYIGILVTTTIFYGWYFIGAFEKARNGDTALADFGPTMWWMMGAYVVLIIIAMATIGIWNNAQADEPNDERDKLISLKGEQVSNLIHGAGLFGLLVMVMSEASSFMIAHAILGTLVLGTILGFAVQIYLYRRGI
ncbi:MAG: hypothetical protein JKY60_03795 [Kordiimonadaceae bacterium]|nr:hypothetical protein [Kordiimonadaceae bacterium]